METIAARPPWWRTQTTSSTLGRLSHQLSVSTAKAGEPKRGSERGLGWEEIELPPGYPAKGSRPWVTVRSGGGDREIQVDADRCSGPVREFLGTATGKCMAVVMSLLLLALLVIIATIVVGPHSSVTRNKGEVPRVVPMVIELADMLVAVGSRVQQHAQACNRPLQMTAERMTGTLAGGGGGGGEGRGKGGKGKGKAGGSEMGAGVSLLFSVAGGMTYPKSAKGLKILEQAYYEQASECLLQPPFMISFPHFGRYDLQVESMRKCVVHLLNASRLLLTQPDLLSKDIPPENRVKLTFDLSILNLVTPLPARLFSANRSTIPHDSLAFLSATTFDIDPNSRSQEDRSKTGSEQIGRA